MAILTLEEYKKRRELTEASKERDEAIEGALASAEDAILQYTDRDFNTAQATETRTFPWEVHTMILDTDDFVGTPSAISIEAPGGVSGPILFPTGAFWVGPREGQTFYWIDFTPARNLSLVSIGQMGFTRNLDTIFESATSGILDFVNVNVTAKFGWAGKVPASVQQAAAWLTDEFRKGAGGAEDIQAEGIADLSFAYQRQRSENATLPPRVQQLLDPYRRPAL